MEKDKLQIFIEHLVALAYNELEDYNFKIGFDALPSNPYHVDIYISEKKVLTEDELPY